MFNAGRWQELWAQVRYRPMRARGARSDPEVAAHVELLVRDGLYSKAAQALEQADMAPATQATHDALTALNPDGSLSGPMPNEPIPAPAPPALNHAIFNKVFGKPPKGSAHGTSGWRMEDYALVHRHCVIEDQVEASLLFRVASNIAAGRIPRAVRPYFAGGRLIGLLKPNGSVRPIVIGEALRRLVGKVLVGQKKEAIGKHFAPARFREVGVVGPAQAVEAAQLGVGIEGGLGELSHAIIVALQAHPFNPIQPGDPPPGTPEGWVCVSVDFKNFFNSISRPAIFRALISNPNFVDLYPFLSQIYHKTDPAKLWVDLGEREWQDILSKEGVQQGCSFGSFLAALGLQPILEDVARSMPSGLLGAYCDDVRICGPIDVAHAAYSRLITQARALLGCEEVPSKGSVMWEGEGSPDVSCFPHNMPGRPCGCHACRAAGTAARLAHDKQLGVFVGDSRPESVAAVKAALQAKFESKATLIERLTLLSDPQIKLQLLRCCASPRPGFWLRTMRPDLTAGAAA